MGFVWFCCILLKGIADLICADSLKMVCKSLHVFSACSCCGYTSSEFHNFNFALFGSSDYLHAFVF